MGAPTEVVLTVPMRPEMKGYTFPALVTSERLIREKPDAARAAIKAVQSAQKALKEDPNRATAIGRKLFPPAEAGMIAELIRRDTRSTTALLRRDHRGDEPLRARPRHPFQSRKIQGRGVERLKGKVAIVTGAGSGIGKALATRLAQDGASVVIADLKSFDTAAAEIAKTTGAKTLGLQVDVSSEADVARMAAETMKAFGRIDILVNNAAIFSTLELRPFDSIPVAEWRKVMEVNVMGVWLCCAACAPHMRAGHYGRIIKLARARR